MLTPGQSPEALTGAETNAQRTVPRKPLPSPLTTTGPRNCHNTLAGPFVREPPVGAHSHSNSSSRDAGRPGSCGGTGGCWAAACLQAWRVLPPTPHPHFQGQESGAECRLGHEGCLGPLVENSVPGIQFLPRDCSAQLRARSWGRGQGAKSAEGTRDWLQLKSWLCHLRTGTSGNLPESSEPQFPHLLYGDCGGFTTLVIRSNEKFLGKRSVPWKTPANIGYPHSNTLGLEAEGCIRTSGGLVSSYGTEVLAGASLGLQAPRLGGGDDTTSLRASVRHGTGRPGNVRHSCPQQW